MNRNMAHKGAEHSWPFIVGSLAFVAAMICVPLSRAEARFAPPRQPADDWKRALVLPDSKAGRDGLKDIVALYTQAQSFLEGLNFLKTIPGSRFAYSVKNISSGSLAFITNVDLKGSVVPLTVRLSQKDYVCELPGEADGEEEGENSAPESVREKDPNAMIKIVAAYAEDAGILPAGSYEKVEMFLDGEECLSPSRPALSKEEDETEDGKESLAKSSGSDKKKSRASLHGVSQKRSLSRNL